MMTLTHLLRSALSHTFLIHVYLPTLTYLYYCTSIPTEMLTCHTVLTHSLPIFNYE
jgi:hypothetical protein